MRHSRRLELVEVFLESILGERWITFTHLDKMNLPPIWISIAAETYRIMINLDFIGTKKCLKTLNNGFKVFTDTVRTVEIGVRSCLVHLKDGESVLLDGELVLVPSHTSYLNTLPLFNAVVGCWDSVVRDIFELVGFLMLVQIVSREEKHGRFNLGHCTAI